jgi:hypothetical protein
MEEPSMTDIRDADPAESAFVATGYCGTYDPIGGSRKHPVPFGVASHARRPVRPLLR